MALDPEQLTPESSINRVRMVDVPGCVLDDGVRGKIAYDLLGLPALTAAIKERAAELGLEDSPDGTDLPLLLGECLSSPNAAVRRTAEAMAARFGRYLGYLITVLVRGDAANRATRPEWDDSHWDVWSRVRHIWLGGGLASGRLGRGMQRSAVGVLEQAGIRECDVRIAAHPAALPLIGAARCNPAASHAAFVVDFGQSYVKRGLARYESSALAALDVLPPLPVPVDESTLPEEMTRLLEEGWQEQSRRAGEIDPFIVASIASYVRDNHPFAYRLGVYARLHEVTDNLGDWLSDQVSDRVGRRVAVLLMHDGTAAAQAFGGDADTAVIMLGTALGSGFAWTRRKVTPLAMGFVVRQRG